MNGVQQQEQVPMIVTNGEEHDRTESEHYQIPMPDQELLRSVSQSRTRSIALDDIKTEFMSAFYGYCFGNAISLFGDSEPDAFKIAGGIGLTIMSSIYVGKILKQSSQNDMNNERSYWSVAKHVGIFGVLAASGCIATWDNFC